MEAGAGVVVVVVRSNHNRHRGKGKCQRAGSYHLTSIKPRKNLPHAVRSSAVVATDHHHHWLSLVVAVAVAVAVADRRQAVLHHRGQMSAGFGVGTSFGVGASPERLPFATESSD